MSGIIVIGLCGRSGSGKGYVSERFCNIGIPVIDTDSVYHDLTTSKDGTPGDCLVEIAEKFGSSVIDESASLNRKVLADMVFADDSSDKLELLNSITHKYIKSETEKQIELNKSLGYKAVIIDAPVLFESGFSEICDYTVFVSADDKTSVRRIVARDGITENEAINRLSHQKNNDELRKLCDFEIRNRDIDDIDSQIHTILKRIGI